MAKRNLLVVDADHRNLRMLEVSLRKAGYSVTTSGDVDGALELIALTEPDLVISDTRLPGKDGFALVTALRERPSEQPIPLMFLSSDPSVESKMRSLALGIEDYLTKPLLIREILARIHLVLERTDRERLGRTAKTRMAGSLEDMGLVDLLQTIEMSRKSGLLKLASGRRAGLVWFSEGRVLDAELGVLTGESAVYRALLWNEGSFELEFRDVKRDDNIGVPTQALLMEGVRRLDEWGRLQEQLPSLDTVLEANTVELADRIGEIPDELNDVLRNFDGQRDLARVLDVVGGDDLQTLTSISKLFFDGFLTVRHPSEVAGDVQVGRHSDPFMGYVPDESVPVPSPATEILTATPATGFAPVAPTPVVSPFASAETRVSNPPPRTTSPAPRPSQPRPSELQASEPRASQPRLSTPEAVDEAMSRAALRTPSVPGPHTVSTLPPPSPAAVMSAVEVDRQARQSDRAASPEAQARATSEAKVQSAPPAASPTASQPKPSDAAHPGAEILHHDDDPNIRDFFSRPVRAGTAWDDDVDVAEPDSRPPQRGMYWTLGIAAAGVAAIGAFLLYNKVFMPTPEELVPGVRALPTPDAMSRPAPAATAIEPDAPMQEQVAPEQPSSSEAPPPPTPAQVTASAAPAAVPPTATGTPAGASTAFDSLLAEARKLGYRRSAEVAYLKALEARPGAPEALSGLAMLYLNQGKNIAARDRAQQAVAHDPKSAEGWIVLGAAESALGDTRAARDAYARCAALPSGSAYVIECKRMLR